MAWEKVGTYDLIPAHDWEHEHKTFGCDDCKFADRSMLFKGACCCYPGKLKYDENFSACLRKRPEED